MFRRSRSSSTSSKFNSKVEFLFNKYRDAGEGSEENILGPESVEKFLSDLGVNPSEVEALIIAWIMDASRMGFFTRQEWLHGFSSIKADSVEKMKASLPNLRDRLLDSYGFREFHAYAFKFCLTEHLQKTIDIDTTVQMLMLTMSGRRHVDTFVKFLQSQKDYKLINKDQWISFLRFSEEIEEDFSNYDDSQAWPSLLDSFAEWVNEGQ